MSQPGRVCVQLRLLLHTSRCTDAYKSRKHLLVIMADRDYALDGWLGLPLPLRPATHTAHSNHAGWQAQLRLSAGERLRHVAGAAAGRAGPWSRLRLGEHPVRAAARHLPLALCGAQVDHPRLSDALQSCNHRQWAQQSEVDVLRNRLIDAESRLQTLQDDRISSAAMPASLLPCTPASRLLHVRDSCAARETTGTVVDTQPQPIAVPAVGFAAASEQVPFAEMLEQLNAIRTRSTGCWSVCGAVGLGAQRGRPAPHMPPAPSCEATFPRRACACARVRATLIRVWIA